MVRAEIHQYETRGMENSIDSQLSQNLQVAIKDVANKSDKWRRVILGKRRDAWGRVRRDAGDSRGRNRLPLSRPISQLSDTFGPCTLRHHSHNCTGRHSWLSVFSTHRESNNIVSATPLRTVSASRVLTGKGLKALWSVLIKGWISQRARGTIDLSRCNAISTSNEEVTRDGTGPLASLSSLANSSTTSHHSGFCPELTL
ncbi:hypothetical protein J6590_006460 [Homalodisca vitripennis]|nr:hypothetical protein J6590_006460 [Homalodisca vitripennis]